MRPIVHAQGGSALSLRQCGEHCRTTETNIPVRGTLRIAAGQRRFLCMQHGAWRGLRAATLLEGGQMRRILVAVTAGSWFIVGCNSTDQVVAPSQESPSPALEIREGAPPPAFVPYVIDPSAKGLASATWRRYSGLPDEAGIPQHALSLALRDGASPESEAGARVSGVAGLAVPKVIGLDFITGGACSADGGLQLTLTTGDGATITLDCAQGTFNPSPVKGAKGWTRVSWSLGDLLPGSTIAGLKLKLTPTKRPSMSIDIGGLIGVAVQPGWPGLRVYVTEVYGSRVVRLDNISSNGSVQDVRSFGAYGNGTGQFSGPTDVYVDDAGRIHVADSFSSRIVRFDDMNGTGWTTATMTCSGPDAIFGCRAETVVGDGRGALLSQFMGGGVYRTSMPAAPTLLAVSQFPSGVPSIALDVFPDIRGRIYATRQDNSLWRFDDDLGRGGVSIALTPVSSAPSSGDRRSLFVDPSSRIYVADRCRITRYDDMTGAGKTAFPATTCFNASTAGPEGVGVDTFGRIYFVTNFNGVSRVYRMNDINGTGLVSLASFPNGRLVSIWVDDRTPGI